MKKKISYLPLRMQLVQKGISRPQLIEMVGMSPTTAIHLFRDEHVSLRLIEKICNILDCDIQDVVTLVEEKE